MNAYPLIHHHWASSTDCLGSESWAGPRNGVLRADVPSIYVPTKTHCAKPATSGTGRPRRRTISLPFVPCVCDRSTAIWSDASLYSEVVVSRCKKNVGPGACWRRPGSARAPELGSQQDCAGPAKTRDISLPTQWADIRFGAAA